MKAGGKSTRARMDPEADLQSFIRKFEPGNQVFIHAVRRALQKMLPSANELVYDNYNFFVIGYSHSERPSDAILSLVADHKGVRVAFPYTGVKLPDPHHVLQGSGTKNRFMRIDSAEDLSRSEFKELLQAAVKLSRPPSPGTKPKLIIRSVSAKQRPRQKSK
ncbi:MAG TPA: hypothetical protein VE994_18595 [Terriglobales bacterium]|nr:hypothetical protein [Terriglobales bacterium]